MASPIFRLSAVKGPMIFLLVLSALPLLAFDLPSLRSPMARYETGSQHYAPITRPPVVTLPEMDFKVAALPRLVFTGETSLSATLDRTLPANAPAANYLEKNPAHASRWLGSSTTGGSVGLGRFLVGYGSVYYDSFYDKPMVFFETKGTRVEEPGCGYLKMTFNF